MSSETTTVRKIRWGIFDIAYDIPSSSEVFPSSITHTLNLNSLKASFYSLRFFKDIFVIAPVTFSMYVLGTLWLGLNPALSLYFTYVVIHFIVVSISTQTILKYPFESMMHFWLLSSIISAIIEHLRGEWEALLCGHLRYHFLPLLAKGYLEADFKAIHDGYHHRFHKSWSFGEGAPGLDLLKAIAYRCQHFLSLFLELSVVAFVIIHQGYQDGQLLTLLTVMLLCVLFFAPRNGAEDQGYTFWTTNKAYHRLNALYTIIFNIRFRETLAKDSLNDYLLREYGVTSRALGVGKTDALTLACQLPPPWYWTLTRHLLLDYPMALCAMIPARFISPYSISTLILFRSISGMVGHSVDHLTHGSGSTTFGDLFVNIRELYEELDSSPSLQRESIAYPNSEQSSSKGMKISLRNVGVSYAVGARRIQVLEGITSEVDAGSFVMLVGSNGSGKSTLLRLLAGLREPSYGEILIDDVPMKQYNTLQLRQHMTFLMQSEELYPLSVRENMLMVVPRPLSDEDVDTKLEDALRLGGAREFVERVGYDTVLDPPSLLGQSLQGCGNGKVGPGALRELEKHIAPRKSLVISCKEKRQLLVSRSFMRLLNSDTRLLMVDESAGALDGFAEDDIFERFLRQRSGKTVIFVPHRFGSLAKHADLILCMKEGKIIEQGRHRELLEKGGEYAKLFQTQM